MSTPHRGTPRVWFDHFVVGIDELEKGIRAFEERTGVRPVFGGEHPALGTHNALVSLGPDQYLEILAPRPGATVRPVFGDVGRCSQLTPILWALATDDVEALHGAVGAAGFGVGELQEGSRVTEAGDVPDPFFRFLMALTGPYGAMEDMLASVGAHFGETVEPERLYDVGD